MMITWPLPKWDKQIGISSTTRRSATLSGGIVDPNETTLGELRRFVAKLEQWPDLAKVQKGSGLVLHVEFFEKADSMGIS